MKLISKFHRRKLPDFSTLLSGHTTQNDVGFKSEKLQIWYNNTDESWISESEKPHKHLDSDECFIVLSGTLIIEVNGEQFSIGPREFRCFPANLYHSIVEIHLPIEAFMIRAPSTDDKVYQEQSR